MGGKVISLGDYSPRVAVRQAAAALQAAQPKIDYNEFFPRLEDDSPTWDWLIAGVLAIVAGACALRYIE